MKVFISWSGVRSRHIADALRKWLPRVIQAVKPWMSDVDIPAGARWQTDIAHELDAADFGIICITPENMDKPWLMFEAGALSKSMKASRVCPLAYSMELTQLSGPIAQFQANRLDQEGVFQVLMAINAAMLDKGLDAIHLREQFEMLWGRLDQALMSVPPYTPPEPEEQVPLPLPPRDPAELMEFVQNMTQKLFRIGAHAQENHVVGKSVENYHVSTRTAVAYAPISLLEGAISGFIPIVSSQHNLQALVATVCADMEKWHSSGAPVPGISLDLSGEEFLSQDHLETLRALGKKYPNAVEVGISETQIGTDLPKMRGFVEEIKAAGFFVGIKKFGTGYSSLSSLREFPLSTIWIDESFVQGVVDDPNSRAIVSAIASLAKHLSIPAVVAEGVSNAEQTKALLELGVKTITGSMAGDVMTSEEVYKRIST